tara:strand:+ start:275 stop:574 length:300 start_codon:yes stop_codon:yes gene_type:complete
MKITETDIAFLIKEQLASILFEQEQPKMKQKDVAGYVGQLQMENAVLNAQVEVFNEVIANIGAALSNPPEAIAPMVGAVLESIGDEMDTAIKKAQKEIS